MTDLILTPPTAQGAKPKTINELIAIIADRHAHLLVGPQPKPAELRAILAALIEQTPLAPALVDEPLFVLRAQDKIAPYAVRAWASEAESYNCDIDKFEGARTIAAEMCAWQMAHPTRVKRPD